MPARNPNQPDGYFKTVEQSLKAVGELTIRIDERVTGLMKKQEATDAKVDAHAQVNAGLNRRLDVLNAQRGCNPTLASFSSSIKGDIDKLKEETEELQESIHKLQMQMQAVTGQATRHDNRWKEIISGVMNTGWILIAAYLIYRFGWQSN